MSKRLLAVKAPIALVLCHLACLAAPVQPNRVPIQAELLKAMEAGRVAVGETVFAKVDIEWKNPACNLRKGAILKGRVVSEKARTKASKTSDLALLFESGQCGGRDLKPLPLTVAALIAPDPRGTGSLYEDQENQSLSDAVGVGLGGGGSAGAGSGFPAGGGGLRSVTAAAATAYVEPTRYKPPKAVLPGQVIGIAGVQLSVGSGPEGSSVLSSSRHNIRLDVGSQFVLVPSPKPVLAASTKASAPAASVAALNPSSTPNKPVLPEVPPLDETDICEPPECSVAVATSEAQSGTTRAAATVSVKELGYALRGNREMDGFDYDAALAYLGPRQILFTFDPHLLVRRTGAEASPQMRTVRAVLIDLQTKRVQRSVDWRVLDAKQYLWPIANEKVLVHVGRELRMYGPGLKIDQRVSLNGPLAFVQISPSGKYFAVGVVQERHSRVVHDQLVEAEGRDPEEDVEVKVLSEEFRVLATVTRTSRDAPPVLSDEGEIRIPTIGKNRWRVVESTWDGQRRVLAQVTSTCKPVATTLQPDLLFLVGCDRQSDGKWYRMLRSDGKPVLKGWSPSEELEQTANGASGTFAVGIAKAVKPIGADSAFRSADLQTENIVVYRVENGRREFAVSIASPVPTLQTFVLSPNGSQLAVLKGDQIAFYMVPGTDEIQR